MVSIGFNLIYGIYGYIFLDNIYIYIDYIRYYIIYLDYHIFQKKSSAEVGFLDHLRFGLLLVPILSQGRNFRRPFFSVAVLGMAGIAPRSHSMVPLKTPDWKDKRKSKICLPLLAASGWHGHD